MKAYFTVPFVAAALCLATPLRANASCGTVEVSKGDVKITSGTTKAVAAAPAGTKICSGDTIVAGVDSRAKLKMEDGNELNISPDSKIIIETYQYNPTENKKKVLLNVLQGKVRATTKQENMYNDKAKDGQANTFEVRTKTAVAGVRGTDFLTSFNPANQKSEVVTFRGKVSFGQLGANGAIVNAVSVAAGQKTDISAGKAPSTPTIVPKTELDKTNSDTKSPDTGANKGAANNSGNAANTAASGDKSADKSSDKSSGSASGGGTASGSAGTGGSAANGGSSLTSGNSDTTRSPAGGGVADAPPPPPPPLPPPPPPPPPVLPPAPPTVPKCDICTAAQQTNQNSKVNITIRIKN